MRNRKHIPFRILAVSLSFIVVVGFVFPYGLPAHAEDRGNPDPQACQISFQDFLEGAKGELLSAGLNVLANAAGEGLNVGLSALANIAVPGGGAAVSKFLNKLGVGGDAEQAVKDAEARFNTFRESAESCIRYLKENAFRVALEDFRKRMIDQLADDVVLWIQNGFDGKPRFIQDFRGYLKDTADAAVGDVAMDLGFAELCSPLQSQNLRSGILLPSARTPHFSDQISCTLTNIVGNVEGFYNDFAQGGWTGYLELLKPQNNRYGQHLLVLDEVMRRTEEKQRAAELEAIAGGGYSSQKRCLSWRVKDPSENALRDPVDTNGKQALESQDALKAPEERHTFSCIDWEILTPGSSVSALADAAITADFQYVANANDFYTYANHILDAAVRRLIEGTDSQGGERGLARAETSRSSRGEKPETVQAYRERIAADETLDPEVQEKKLRALDTYEQAGQNFQEATNFDERLRSALATSTRLVLLDLQALWNPSTGRTLTDAAGLIPDVRRLSLALPEREGDLQNLIDCQRVAFQAACSVTQELNTELKENIKKLADAPPSFDEHLDRVQYLIQQTGVIQGRIGSATGSDITSLTHSLNEIRNEADTLRVVYEGLRDPLLPLSDEITSELQACRNRTPQHPYICPAERGATVQ